MTILCPKCGAKNKDDAISCRICGRVIGDGVAQSQKPTQYRSVWGYIGLLILLLAVIIVYLWLTGVLSLGNLGGSQTPPANTVTTNTVTTNTVTTPPPNTITTPPPNTTTKPPKKHKAGSDNSTSPGINVTLP